MSNPFDFWTVFNGHQRSYEHLKYESHHLPWWHFKRRRVLLEGAERHLRAMRQMLKNDVHQRTQQFDHELIGRLEKEIYRKSDD